jgi:hydroxyethylthiazole kinase-like uncharacterized protein yjeF
MEAAARIRAALGRFSSQETAPPQGGLVGAALALLHETDDGELAILYTRRREDLSHHPGQISFPGGRAERGETIEQAALREAAEEIALDTASVELLGALPPFYIPPSRFWLQVVVGRWRVPHPLVAAEAEVAEILTVGLPQLCDAATWRVVRLSSGGWTWAWKLDGDHLLWGATAMVTSVLLDVLDPQWHRGTRPADLAGDREVRPWDRPDAAVPLPRRARLPGVPEVPVDAVGYADPSQLAEGLDAGLQPDALRAAGDATADAVRRLLAGAGARRVLVLAGPGGNGVVGATAGAVLLRAGFDVAVVGASPRAGMPPAVSSLADGVVLQPFAGELPDADVVVDALVGGGLDGPLHGVPRDVVLALRHHVVPVVSVDLPSGLDSERGLVGDTVTADVTLALGRPRGGLFHAGLGPYVGDLYAADLGAAPRLLRLVRGASAGMLGGASPDGGTGQTRGP